MLMSSARAGRAGLSLSATPFRPAVLCSSIAAAGDRIRRNSRRGLDGRPNAGGRPRTTTVAGQEKIHGTSKNSCMGEIHQSVWASERSERGRGGGAERRTSNSASCESERAGGRTAKCSVGKGKTRQADGQRERDEIPTFPRQSTNFNLRNAFSHLRNVCPHAQEGGGTRHGGPGPHPRATPGVVESCRTVTATTEFHSTPLLNLGDARPSRSRSCTVVVSVLGTN